MRRTIVSILLLLFFFMGSPVHAGEKPEAVLYKTPNCGCCEGYASYLREHGYKVTVKPSHDMPMIKKLAGVPEALEGCHTTMIDAYVIEGHVPIASLDKLLKERPKIRGISLPGMPQGSPGMSGHKSAPFKIYEINDGGEHKAFFVE